MNYEKDITIDETALDVEWLEQPRLMLKYSKNSAQMRMELDKTKQDLDIAKAEADKKIRSNPEKYGIEKITEAVIANSILNEVGYKSAYTTYLEAKYELDMSQAAVVAFEQRKSALENLVRLHGQQYFAGPQVPRNLSEERELRQKRVDESIAKLTLRRLNR